MNIVSMKEKNISCYISNKLHLYNKPYRNPYRAGFRSIQHK